jgi:hypothetical protein
MTPEQEKTRDMIAGLILNDPDSDEDLVVCSDLSNEPDGSMTFNIRQDKIDGSVYRVTIKIEEV